MDYPILKLKEKSIKSIKRRHPWVFSGAISSDMSELSEGEKVCIADGRGNILGTGHFGKRSIAIRLLSFEHTILDENFYQLKLQNALDTRTLLGLPSSHTDAFRLVHGEGDQLPGLVIDVYANYAVVQTHSAGMDNDFPLIEKSLRQLTGVQIAEIIKVSAEKNGSDHVFSKDGTEITEHGHKFYANWAKGQKTGFFIDQRENRALLGSLSKGKKVLNTFSYTGGFSIYALKAGATHVHSLDSSSLALKLGEEHVRMNNLSEDKHESIQADALSFFGEADVAAYDIIVLDPPAFAKHRSARHKAIQAYKRLNSMAIKKAKSGTLLMTFSCSQVVTPDLFEHTIASAAMDTRRSVRVLRHLHQPADHPVSIYHPEGEYLKGLLLRID